MIFFILLSFILPASRAFGQQQPEAPLFRAGVALVKVDARVTDKKGNAITGLTAADFQLFDEGQPQKIVYFGQEKEPLDLLLLLDVSGSMHRYLEEMARTTQAALAPLAEGDRVGVMVFARNSSVRQELTGNFAEVQAGIKDAVRDNTQGSGTAINSAIIAAAEYMQKQPVKGRRAVLIVTDNTSLNYQVPDEDVIRHLYAADAVLNVILIGKQAHPDKLKNASYVNPDFTPSDVYKLATETGGEMLEARKGQDSFPQMIEHIRARYSLQYDAPAAAPGQFRRVRVELSPHALQAHPGAQVRARAGYYAAK